MISIRAGFPTRGSLRQAVGLFSRSMIYWSDRAISRMEEHRRSRADEPAVEKLDCIEVFVSRGYGYFLILGTPDRARVSLWLSMLVSKNPLVPMTLSMLGGSCVTTALIANAILAVYCCPGGENLCPMLIDQAGEGIFQ